MQSGLTASFLFYRNEVMPRATTIVGLLALPRAPTNPLVSRLAVPGCRGSARGWVVHMQASYAELRYERKPQFGPDDGGKQVPPACTAALHVRPLMTNLLSSREIAIEHGARD